MAFDFDAVSNISLWAYLIVFLGGIVTSIGPCNMAMIPLVMAFVGGQKQITRRHSLALSSAFALGLAITLMGLGVFASIVGGLIGGSCSMWYYVVAAVCIIMGLQWIGAISLSMPAWGARQRERIKRRGVLGAPYWGFFRRSIHSVWKGPPPGLSTR